MPPKFPWKAAVLCVVAIVVMGTVIVHHWPGVRKGHAIKPAVQTER